jgi:hypothetical protein
MSSDSTEKDALIAENERLRDSTEKATQHANEIDRQMRQPLIDSLVTDSRGRLKRDALEKLSMETLKTIKRTYIGKVAKNYQDFCDERDQKYRDSQKQNEPLGMGVYNPETKKWEGGLPDGQDGEKGV